MSVAIIDYGSGNLHSARKAFERAAREAGLAPEVWVTADPAAVGRATHVVLPGVGAFADCMAGLRAIPGMTEALSEAVLTRGVPFLGICVGMQLLASVGREFGDHDGLGWIAGEVVRLSPSDPALKIPHMGWNMVARERDHPILAGIRDDNLAFYFVHSFAMRCNAPRDVVGTAQYGQQVTAVIARDNIAATQFQPEKSQDSGIELVRNFLRWNP